MKVFRDPIHGQIAWDDSPADRLLLSIVDTLAFQRLRLIKQLSLVNYVFHGAEHSRFSHSIGVCHLAGVMFDKLVRARPGISVSPFRDVEHARLCVRIAALVHDVGHAAFSHLFENLMHSVGHHVFSHERVTARFVQDETSEIHRLLSAYDPTLPASVATFFDASLRAEESWIYRIVSSQLDADRLDYLVRDATCCGIPHGCDVGHILDNMYPEGAHIVLSSGCTESMEAFLLMIKHMYKAIYFHRVHRASYFMLESVLLRALQTKAFSENHPFVRAVQMESCDLDTYVEITDASIWPQIFSFRRAEDPFLAAQAQAFLSRQLYRSFPVHYRCLQEGMAHLAALKDCARAYSETHYGTDYSDQLVRLDESALTAYHDFSWWTGGRGDESIRLVHEGRALPLEAINEPIIQSFRERVYPYLLIHRGVFDILPASEAHALQALL